MCSAAVEGSRSATSERIASHIGEIAKRVRARSSTEKTKRTIAGRYAVGTMISNVEPSGSAK